MSYRITAKVMDMTLPPSQKLVLFALANAANDEDFTCWPSHKRIAEIACVSIATAKVCLNALRDAGLISWEPRVQKMGGDSSNLYLIDFAKLTPVRIQLPPSQNLATPPSESGYPSVNTVNEPITEPSNTHIDEIPPSEVPEWLTILRQAVPYKLDPTKERALIQSVSRLGLADDLVSSTAQSLAAQWPYKSHKHLDLTLMSWLRGSMKRNGVSQGGEVRPDSRDDALEQAAVRSMARQKRMDELGISPMSRARREADGTST